MFGRGRGRGRGWRGYKRGGDRSHNDRYFGKHRVCDEEPEQDGGNKRGRGRGRHPPELKGREIGLWYARKGQLSNKFDRQELTMDNGRARNLNKMVQDIRASEECPPQPSTSYRDPSQVPDCWDFESDRNMSRPISQATLVKTEPGLTPSSSTASLEEMDDDVDIKYEDVLSLRELKSEVDVDFKIGDDLMPVSNDSRLVRDEALDKILLDEICRKQSQSEFSKMLEFRKKLPAWDKKSEVIELLKNNQVLVISGETGCGKTTQVSQFILDDYISKGQGSLCRIICTQPRRISAISVAERVAQERAESCGESVGYQIRLESKLSRNQGYILFCTTGIVLQWLQSNRKLDNISHIIIDEIHERDLQSDFLMIVVRDLLPKRPDLKLILMSATLNAEMFSQYFSNCPMLNIPGFTYPVKEHYLEDVIELIKYEPSAPVTKKRQRGSREERQRQEDEQKKYQTWVNSLFGKYDNSTLRCLSRMDHTEFDLNLVVKLVDHICNNEPDGSILVFLPGWTDISKVHKDLTANRQFSSERFRIIPLHSMMPTLNQRQVFERPPPGVRKIVIATNIAETSITIDDIVYVIDCGKSKIKNYDPVKNICTLQPEWNSHANSKQRRGRAGRVQAGVCYHLYTNYQRELLIDYQLPEMLRTRLEELCLQIKMLKLGSIMPFVNKALQPPPPLSLERSIKLLKDMNALDHEEELTSLGYHLAQMPVDPQIGKMILFSAMFCCVDPILTIAATLSFKDPFIIPLGKEREADLCRKRLSRGTKSDHMTIVNVFNDWQRAEKRGTGSQYCWDNFLSKSNLQMLLKMKGQLYDLLKDIGYIKNRYYHDHQVNINSNNDKVVKAVICAGLYPNVARIIQKTKKHRPSMTKLVTNSDGKVAFHPKSVNSDEAVFDSSWLVYHLKMKTAKVYLYDTSVVSPYPLLFFGGNIKTFQDEGGDSISVDKWITFKSSPDIAKIVMDLRVELDHVLQDKIRNPGITEWGGTTKEGAVMKAILDLITMETCQDR